MCVILRREQTSKPNYTFTAHGGGRLMLQAQGKCIRLTRWVSGRPLRTSNTVVFVIDWRKSQMEPDGATLVPGKLHIPRRRSILYEAIG